MSVAKIGNRTYIAVKGGVIIYEIDLTPPVKPKYRRFIANSWYPDEEIARL